tara:strand:- start:349 stop:696 length:348 start_codon:yes stop_codon:yes gene_type:complete
MMNVGVSIFAASFLFLFFFVVKVVGVGVLKESKKKTGDGVEDDDKGKEVVAKCTHFLNFSNDVGQKYRRLRKKRRRRRRRRERRTHLIVHVRDVFVAVDIVEPFLAIFFQTFELL